MKRKDFITHSAIIGAGVLLLPDKLMAAKNKTSPKKARLAFIGVGMRGAGLLKETVAQGLSEIVAVSDINETAIGNAKQIIKEYGLKEPDYYLKENDFEKIVTRDDVDGVIIATPWKWHLPISVASLKAGKHTGCEVLAGLTVPEIWELVNVQEKNGAPYMMLENVCYRRDVMAVLNMARKNLFGEITYAECGYQHDLREVIFNDGVHNMMGLGVEFGEKGINEARWRTQNYIGRNGDLYPTHGIGPISNMLDITRGNQFAQLVSMASPANSLHQYIVDKGGANHPNAKVKFKCGDVVTTLIKCVNGEVIKMTFDTSSPRPYSLGFRIQGSEGIWTDDVQGIYLQKQAPKPHEYEPVQKFINEYDHPYWKKHGLKAESSGHGGMDYFIIREFVDCVANKKPFLMDVYDAAAWSALSPLSEKSIAKNSQPILIPDFTRGKWKKRKPVFGLQDDFNS
jgi:predicted dehydrogenase